MAMAINLKTWMLVSGVATLFIGGAAAALRHGNRRSRRHTDVLRASLDAERVAVRPAEYDPRELDGLPAPVQRYFQAALGPVRRRLAALTLKQIGSFNLSESAERWRPFAATQRVVLQRPGFDWFARIGFAPFLSVHVNDTYLAGQGHLRAALSGLIMLADIGDTPEMAQGELMRFLAEAPWYPTALLPSQGVRWQEVDDRSAVATLQDGTIQVTLLFRFSPDGLIDSVHADARGRMLNGGVVPTPWEGRWWGYAQRDGMQVPLSCEVTWITPEGPKPYFRGHVTLVAYEWAGA
ncbi:hypothetical protein J2739_001812 [Variovorax soli]|uniref:Uncharacterized protein n=2 Tax=Variovorax soli TaxID=376815 RepID=A0ABU1NC53_9BURK|nr:hypothetical protein [Variovorax soli]